MTTTLLDPVLAPTSLGREGSLEMRERYEVVNTKVIQGLPTHVPIDFILRPGEALRFEGAFGQKELVPVLGVAQGHGQGTPGHQAHSNLVVHLRQIQFALLPTEHMVFGLFHDRGDAIELPAVGVRLHDLHLTPPGSAPVHGPALLYHIAHGSHHLCKVYLYLVYCAYSVGMSCRTHPPWDTWDPPCG